MNRRQGIIASISAIIGLMSGEAKSEDLTNSLSLPIAQGVIFNFDSFTTFTFIHEGEKISMTGAEIFEALKSSK